MPHLPRLAARPFAALRLAATRLAPRRLAGALLLAMLAPVPRAGGLPDALQLDAVTDGDVCRVHYTLDGADAVPDAAFAAAVARAVDAVARRTAKHFLAPIPEPAGEGDERLHVYLQDTSGAPALDAPAHGWTQAVETVPGQVFSSSVYLVLDADLRAEAEAAGLPWRRVLRAAVAHLYFHAIQAAYDDGLDAWASEGQAVWAELRFARSSDGLAAHLAASDSIVNAPELSIATEGSRAYGTAPLFAALEQALGPGGNRALLEASSAADDALGAIAAALQAQAGIDFETFYLDYLARLAQGRVRGVRRAIVPELATHSEVQVAPSWSALGALPPTGVRAYVLRAPQDDGPGVGRLFAKVSAIGGEASPAGVLLRGRRAAQSLTGGAWNGVGGFRPNRTALLLVTDASLADTGPLPTPFQVVACTPELRLLEVVVQSPIPIAGISLLTLRYDLLGTPPGATFTIDLASRAKSKGFLDDQVQSFVWTTGSDQSFDLLFQAPFVPAQAATFVIDLEVRAPAGSLGGAIVADRARVRVVVQDEP